LREKIVQHSDGLLVSKFVNVEFFVNVNNDVRKYETIWLLDAFLKENKAIFVDDKVRVNSSICEYSNQSEDHINISDIKLPVILVLNLVKLYIYEGNY